MLTSLALILQSVLWKWLPTSVFYSRSFHILLQGCHLAALACLTHAYLRPEKTPLPLKPGRGKSQSANLRRACLFLITTHFAGIIFAKSLHYSFFVWYFHTLPALYRAADLSWLYRPVLQLWLEVCWNQWHQYKTNSDGSVDRLDSCGSWKGGLGMFAAHLLLGALVLRQAYANNPKARLTDGNR